MGFMNNFVRSNAYKQFMSKLYGWGASVVILGALFKITHIKGADLFLFIGLITESIIFFFSAFEPLHIEYDWSLVYPELAGMEEGKKEKKDKLAGKTVTQQLDMMLEEAKIGPALIQSLADGMRNLGDNALKLSGVADAAAATDGYISNLNNAAKSVGDLSKAYTKVADELEQDARVSEQFNTSLKNAAEKASDLSSIYNQTAQSLKDDINAVDDLAKSVKGATNVINSLSENYTKSAEMLSKSAEALNFQVPEGNAYGEQLRKISQNLSALNTVYELQLQNSNKQVEATSKMHETISLFLSNLNDSVDNTVRYKDQVNMLTKNVAALNKVYGNMLSAMNVTA